MRFKVLDGFCLGGSYGDVVPGDTVELSANVAAPYLAIGRLAPEAEPSEAVSEKPLPAPGVIEVTNVPVLNRDPKPAKRGASRVEKE